MQQISVYARVTLAASTVWREYGAALDRNDHEAAAAHMEQAAALDRAAIASLLLLDSDAARDAARIEYHELYTTLRFIEKIARI